MSFSLSTLLFVIIETSSVPFASIMISSLTWPGFIFLIIPGILFLQLMAKSFPAALSKFQYDTKFIPVCKSRINTTSSRIMSSISLTILCATANVSIRAGFEQNESRLIMIK